MVPLGDHLKFGVDFGVIIGGLSYQGRSAKERETVLYKVGGHLNSVGQFICKDLKVHGEGTIKLKIPRSFRARLIGPELYELKRDKSEDNTFNDTLNFIK